MVCSAFRSAAETKSAGALRATCSSASSPKSRLSPRAALRAASLITFRSADWLIMGRDTYWSGLRKARIASAAFSDAGGDLGVERLHRGGRAVAEAPDARRDG